MGCFIVPKGAKQCFNEMCCVDWRLISGRRSDAFWGWGRGGGKEGLRGGGGRAQWVMVYF